jgi:hypothetical protein
VEAGIHGNSQEDDFLDGVEKAMILWLHPDGMSRYLKLYQQRAEDHLKQKLYHQFIVLDGTGTICTSTDCTLLVAPANLVMWWRMNTIRRSTMRRINMIRRKVLIR